MPSCAALGMIQMATSMSTCRTQNEYMALMVPFITLACLSDRASYNLSWLCCPALLALHACLHARTSALVSLLHASCRRLAAVAKLQSHSAMQRDVHCACQANMHIPCIQSAAPLFCPSCQTSACHPPVAATGNTMMFTRLSRAYDASLPTSC